MKNFLRSIRHAYFSNDRGSLSVLEYFLPKDDKRYATFELALQLISEMKPQILVETGTSRLGKRNFIGDGGSTYIFGEWAQQNGAILYSVDISPESLRGAHRGLDAKYASSVDFVQSDSVRFLHQFGRTIDFLYLDSYDFDENFPHLSQQHHLKEITAASPWLASHSIVMIDDCGGVPHGGKGTLAIEYLLERGWEFLANDYQVIMRKPT